MSSCIVPSMRFKTKVQNLMSTAERSSRAYEREADGGYRGYTTAPLHNDDSLTRCRAVAWVARTRHVVTLAKQCLDFVASLRSIIYKEGSCVRSSRVMPRSTTKTGIVGDQAPVRNSDGATGGRLARLVSHAKQPHHDIMRACLLQQPQHTMRNLRSA